MSSVEELQKKASEIRLKSLKAIQKSGMAACGSAMSVVDILVSLYYGEISGVPLLHFDAGKPGWDGQDYLVMAKGEASSVLYAILSDLGFFDESEMEYFAQVNSLLSGRPSMKIPGVSMSSFVPGHGLSQACGLALAVKADRAENRVYCVIDTMQLQGGQVWEAITMAAFSKLNNLVLIVDDCGVQSEGATRSIMDVGFLQTKFDSFGWQVYRVTDGHDYDQLLNALNKSFNAVRKPVCIWCQTRSGKGVDFAENNVGYFNATLSENEYFQVMQKNGQCM